MFILSELKCLKMKVFALFFVVFAQTTLFTVEGKPQYPHSGIPFPFYIEPPTRQQQQQQQHLQQQQMQQHLQQQQLQHQLQQQLPQQLHQQKQQQHVSGIRQSPYLPFFPFASRPFVHQSMSGYHHSIFIFPGTQSGMIPAGVHPTGMIPAGVHPTGILSTGQSNSGMKYPVGPVSPSQGPQMFVQDGLNFIPVTNINQVPTNYDEDSEEDSSEDSSEESSEDSDEDAYDVGSVVSGQSPPPSPGSGQNGESILFPETPLQVRENQCSYFQENGVCYSLSSCRAKGGIPTIYCRDITKFCCLFKLSCDQTTQEDIAYFRNPNFPLDESIKTSCGITVKRSSRDICYIRVTPTGLKLPASIGYCDGISLTATLGSKTHAPLCGDLTHKSYAVDVKTKDTVHLSINTNRELKLGWKVTITQIPCEGGDPGPMWPGSNGEVVPPQQSPPEPMDPSENFPPGIIEDTFAPGTSPVEPITARCGVSGHKAKHSNVRDRGQMIVASKYEQAMSNVGQRSQLPLRDDDDDDKEKEECSRYSGNCSYNSTNENPLLTSLLWDVPDFKDTVLYKYRGPPLTYSNRITYGMETEPHQYPWSIAMYKNGRYHCGASLISEQHVLTAAHCVIRYAKSPSSLKLSIGDWNINSVSDGTNLERKISKVVTHPGYSAVTLKYDVAVLTLDKPVLLSDTVRHICLPPSGLNVEGKIITVIGWGRDEKNRLQSKLMQHSAGVVSNTECNTKWSKTGAPFGIIADTMLCMNPQNGDSCKGDSGGPAIMEYPSGSGVYIQAGVVSFGSASCTDKNLPGVYTKVSSVTDWIKKQMV